MIKLISLEKKNLLQENDTLKYFCFNKKKLRCQSNFKILLMSKELSLNGRAMWFQNTIHIDFFLFLPNQLFVYSPSPSERKLLIIMFRHKMRKVQTMKRIYWAILYNEILLLSCTECKKLVIK